MRTLSLALALVATTLACGGGNETKDQGAARDPSPDGPAPAATVAAPGPAQTERIVLDAAYAAEHGYELPARIEFEVPAANLHRQSPPADQRVFLRLDRTSADGRPVEDLMITSLTIPPGEDEQRRTFAKELVQTQGLPRAMPGEARVLEVREIEVAGIPAILGIGEFEAENSGRVYASMVALILPAPASVSIMAHHVVATSEVKSPGDVTEKGLLAAALRSMSIDP